MKKYMILALVGKDQPGIVHDVSNILFEHGASLGESRMAAMGGRFAMMTLFSFEAEKEEALRESLGAFDRKGFVTNLHEADDPADIHKTAELPLNLEVTAMDNPGIVRRVVKVLHQHGVNIESLDTQVRPAPYQGTQLFDLYLEASVPENVKIVQVKEDLLDLASDMNLDLAFIK